MLFLGSQSKIKLEAAEAAFPNHNVVGYSVNSGVPEQPVGMNETRLGALNRALGAAKAAVNVKGESSSTSNQEWSVGVENGIWNPLDPYCKNTAKMHPHLPQQMTVHGSMVHVVLLYEVMVKCV